MPHLTERLICCSPPTHAADEHDLEVEPLSPHAMYRVARRGHPLGRRAPLRLVQLFAYPLLALSRVPPRVLGPMQAIEQDSGRRQPGRPFPAIELASLQAMKRLLANSEAALARTEGALIARHAPIGKRSPKRRERSTR